MAAKKKVQYDESAIQTLDALEHIRLRTGMYIGRIGDGTHPQDGVYVLHFSSQQLLSEVRSNIYGNSGATITHINRSAQSFISLVV